MNKKIISLGLASVFLVGNIGFTADTYDKEVVSEIQEESENITHSGKISEIIEGDKNVSIIVEGPSSSAINFNISKETVVLSDRTQSFIDKEKLKKGDTVEVSYKSDQAMTRSIPPMTNANVVIVKELREEKEEISIKIDTFNEDLVSSDNFLKFNVTEDTLIEDTKGNRLDEEDLYNKELVVFYGPTMTMSIPAQSNAVKVIVLSEEDTVEDLEIKSLDKIIYKGKEIKLNNEIYKSENTFMIPMREVGEGLGYEISWDSKANQAELIMGTNVVTTTLNEDMYSFSKMIVKLGKSSEVKDRTTFIPVSFLDEVMGLDMKITKDGIINIK